MDTLFMEEDRYLFEETETENMLIVAIDATKFTYMATI